MRKKHEDAQKFLRRFRKQISALDRRFLHAWKRGILTTAKKSPSCPQIAADYETAAYV
jgi:hypothetical protein